MEKEVEPGIVKIKVLSPSIELTVSEFRVELSSTVSMLKERIISTHCAPDDLKDVRLLYGGKILKEGECLLDILKTPDCDTYTIHLCCSNANININKTKTQESGAAVTESSTNVGNISPDYQTMFGYQGYQSFSYGQDQLYNTDINQLAVMQDMYAHYLNQYMQYVNMAQMTSQFPTNIVNQQPETPETNQPAPDPAQREQPEAGQVLAAGGGGLVQEEVAGGERDILDWMYLSSRLVLLLSIVYFYSSIGRFVIVLCIGGLFYFYQIGAFGRRSQRRQRDRDRRLEERRERFRERVREFRDRLRRMQPENNVNIENQENQEINNNVNNNEENLAEEEVVNLNDEQAQLVPDTPSPWSLATNFVYMFFASLFPENAQVA